MRVIAGQSRSCWRRPDQVDQQRVVEPLVLRLTADNRREFAAQRAAAGLEAITLGKLRHSNISRMRAAGIAADVVAAWHGHTERMTQAVYGRVTDDRLTAAADVFSSAVGQI
jgi:integrase